MTDQPMKYAIMLNGMFIRRFQAESLQLIHDSGLAIPVALIVPEQTTGKSTLKKSIFSRDRLFTFLLNRTFKVRQDEMVSLPSFLQDVQVIEAKTYLKGKHSTFFERESIEKIKKAAPDFILRYGFNIVRGEILGSAPLGIWSFHHGDERKYRGGPYGFWEIFNHDRQTGIIFQQLKDQLDGGNVFERRLYATVFHSYKEMREKLLQECTDMPLRALKSFVFNGSHPEFLCDEVKGAVFRNPSNAVMFLFLIKLWKNRIIYYLQKYFRHESWRIAVFDDVNELIKKGGRVAPSKIIKPDTKNLFYADCFLLSNNELVAEEYSYKKAKGKIVRIDINTGIKSDFLEAPYHLAYPYVFRENGKTTLLFEQSASTMQESREYDGGILLPPIQLCNNYLIDASLLRHKNRYYLFASQKGQYPNEKLFILHSTQINGPYMAHPMNPVKVDSSGTRMAGQFFEFGNKIIRPAQSSVKHYGESIKLFCIEELTETTYKESEYGEIKPNRINGRKTCGTHTISLLGQKCIIDYKFHRFILSAFVAKLFKQY